VIGDKLRDFEINIATRFKAGGHAAVSPKAEWIKGHLLDVRSDYIYGMWKKYVSFSRAALERFMVSIHLGTYSSFRTYVYLLRKLGLVLFDRVEKAEPEIPRKYYRLNMRQLDDPSWKAPFQALYPVTDWKKKTSREKHRLRKKYPRGKGRRRGRPPKYFKEVP